MMNTERLIIDTHISGYLMAVDRINELNELEARGLPFDFEKRNQLLLDEMWHWNCALQTCLEHVSIQDLNDMLQ